MKTDLISRSAAIEWLERRLDSWADRHECCYEIEHEIPAVDAVPVVRCKDCKWWGLPEGMYATENVKHCEFGRYMVTSDGYCVYGEVKSNAAD